MSPTLQRILLSCTVMTLVACLCLSGLAIAGAGVFLLEDQITENLLPMQELEPLIEPEAAPEEGNLPPGVAQQMNRIQSEVIALRGLEPGSKVARELLTPDALRQNVINDFLSEYSEEEAREDTLALAAFGLLEPDFDLFNLYIELYSEQIAGYYDDESEAMFIVQGESFAGPERMTYAHEYTHALQDRNYDFEDFMGYTQEACEADSERCSAIQALIEGDATLTELQWLASYATPQDMSDIQTFYETFDSPVFDNAPPFLRESLMFPYLTGQKFAQHLYEQGGWDAVNEAYQNPPVSTEQILHPTRYPEDTPEAVFLPDLQPVLGADWRILDQNMMGEWGNILILAYGADPAGQQPLAQAERAAAGWEGDQYAVYYNDQRQATAMILKTVWENDKEASEFATAFQAYAEGRFGLPESSQGGQAAWQSHAGYTLFVQDGLETLWVLAPDTAAAEIILQTIQESK